MRCASDIPGGFHASRVLLVDDDKTFHEKSVGYSGGNNVSYVFQLSPKDSLKIINAHQGPINMGNEIYNNNRQYKYIEHGPLIDDLEPIMDVFIMFFQ